MKVGWVGLGKLGLTCALTLEQHAGVDIIGFDPNPDVGKILNGAMPPRSREQGLEELIAATQMTLADSAEDVVAATDGLIFCSVQTPHGEAYGGERPMPGTPADFNYSYLVAAARSVSEAADRLERTVTLVIISTCLPGTVRRLVMPVLSERVAVVYNPFFIAMGTTMHDFLHPEFVLIGVDHDRPADIRPLVDLYGDLVGADPYVRRPAIRLMSIESAELTKVAYNAAISLKIVLANTLMEICDRIPEADVDAVTESLAQATDRIVSPKYLTAGMGDGGACHPRDGIAMSWLAQHLDLSVDLFGYTSWAREAQTGWLARQVGYHHMAHPALPIVLLGKAYKPESDLTYGSPALLLAHKLRNHGLAFEHWDHHVDEQPTLDLAALTGLANPALWVICTRHPEYADLRFPRGSVVIDPFRYIPDQEGVEIIGIGRGR